MGRIYKLSSVHNFRDFGLYETASGNHIRAGKLLRSANLNKASEDDLKIIEDLDIGLIVDLRYRPERDRQPNKWPKSQTPTVFEYPDDLQKDKQDVAPHEMFIQRDLNKAEDARQYMHKSYAARPHDPGFIKIFADTLRYMSDTGKPILIHCAAGKDRTGTLAAIIHAALGVPRNVIMDDYMLTMTAVDIDSFLKPAAQMMETRFGRPYDPEALRPMFGVEPEYLENSLEAMGDIDSYISQILGIKKPELEKLRQYYLET